MKILVAHNFYRTSQPSGENEAVLDDVRLLRNAGVEVVEHFAYSDSIERMRPLRKAMMATGPVVNVLGVRDFASAVEQHRPDLVHVHNLQPLISPAVIGAARRRGLPIVHTVHNYRHACLPGTLLRDGRVCTDCVQRRAPLPGVLRGCYRGSVAQSAAAATGQVVHRRTWRGLDRYFVLTPFMADFLAGIGLPRERFVVRPTTISDPGESGPPGQDLVFIGRLEQGKGVDLLVDAWRLLPVMEGRRLRVVGAGPLLGSVRALADRRPDVTVLGQLPQDRIGVELRAAAAVVVPSRYIEGFPRVIVEAFAHGRPVLVPRGGNLASVSPEQCSYHFDLDVQSLADAMLSAQDLTLLADKARAARRHYMAALTPHAGMATLVDCYRSLVARRSMRTKGAP